MTMPTPASCLPSSPDTPRPWLAAYPEGIDWNLDIRPRSLNTLFADAVARFGARPCLDFMGARTTYAELGRQVDRAAKGFRALGVGPGVKVGLCLPNSPYSVICFFAVLKAGGTVVNYNPLYVERELEHQITDSETDIMVTIDLQLILPKMVTVLERTRLRTVVVCSLADALPALKRPLFRLFKRAEIAQPPAGDTRFITFEALVTNDGAMTAPVLDPQATIAVLQYTGGTTGVPKGAMLTHHNVAANAEQCCRWFVGARPGQEKMLGVLPFFHVFAMTAVMNLAIRLGGEIIMLPRFDLDQVMQTIHDKKPTLFPAVPTIYTAINHHKDLARYDLSSVRYCLSGGASLPAEVRDAFVRLTGCVLVEGYGLSEASPVVTCNPINPTDKQGTIGLPLPGTVVEIVSLDEPRRVLPVGEKGEVCVRGPQVMKGYWNKPYETEITLIDGRLHTGDVGVMDADGYVTIVDRIKDMILCSGFNVYPRNVEEAIYLHPAVAECVVAGVPDEYRGQTVKAYIRIADGHTLNKEALLAFLKDKLSPIEMPKIVEFRGDLPKTMIGKLSRKALLEEEESRRRAGQGAA